MALTDNLLASYSLDETSGSTAYDNLGNNNGTLYNGASNNETGKIGKCVLFDGNDSLLDLGDNTFYGNLSNNKFTASLWIKFVSFPGSGEERYLFCLHSRTTGGDRISAQINGDDNTLYFWFLPQSMTWAEFTSYDISGLSTGVWYHFVFVANGNGNPLKIYLNAASVEERVFSPVRQF